MRNSGWSEGQLYKGHYQLHSAESAGVERAYLEKSVGWNPAHSMKCIIDLFPEFECLFSEGKKIHPYSS